MLDAKLNVLLTYVEVQAALFRLFVLCCIHLLSSWSWSAILFVADPLPASTIQTHEGETLTRRMRRKPAHLGMTKTFKAFSVSQTFFSFSPFSHIMQTSSSRKKIFYIFGGMCYLCFSGPWGFGEPPQNEVRACSSCQAACSIEILPPLMRSRGKTNF